MSFLVALLLAGICFLPTFSKADGGGTKREWRHADGTWAAEAEVVELLEGAVRLQLEDGRMYRVSLERLSGKDLDYVRLLAGAGDWTEDLSVAKRRQRQTGLPMLLFITGSDWCPYCREFQEKILESNEFVSFAEKNLVLLKADFREGQSLEKQKQNEALKMEYARDSGFPAVVLINESGRSLASFSGYRKESPAKFVSKLSKSLHGSLREVTATSTVEAAKIE